MKELISISVTYILVAVCFVLLLNVFWNNELEISHLGIIVAIGSLLFTLWYEQAKNVKRREVKKQSLTVYKRELLFKLSGTLPIIHWSLFCYMSNKISIMYTTKIKIGNIGVGEFQKIQINSYKIYYDEIKYFSTSGIVPLYIKEDLDNLNLYAEKLIGNLPSQAGKLNYVILSNYIMILLEIVKGSIKNEDSYELCRNANEILGWIDRLVRLREIEDKIALEVD